VIEPLSGLDDSVINFANYKITMDHPLGISPSGVITVGGFGCRIHVSSHDFFSKQWLTTFMYLFNTAIIVLCAFADIVNFIELTKNK